MPGTAVPGSTSSEDEPRKGMTTDQDSVASAIEEDVFAPEPTTTSGDRTTSNDSASEGRDEVKEIKKRSEKETRRVLQWRAIVILLLVATGVAVSWVTYAFLRDEEYDNFETAFDQFSRTVRDAAINQQKVVREAYGTLADAVANTAESDPHQDWPYFTMPKFEHYAENARQQGGLEILVVYNLVQRGGEAAYLNYSSAHYEDWVHEGHMIRSGNTDRLNAVGYNNYISRPSPNGFVPDMERDFYFASWTFSPPPASYGVINWNIAGVPDFVDVIGTLLQVQDEVTVSKVRPYIGVPLALSKEEHDAMHDQVEGSDSEHPHSFAFKLIRRDPSDPTSEPVGLIGGALAWDFSLLNLLPQGVNGLFAIVSNDCNQTYTYELEGQRAYFRGEGDLHEMAYHSYGVEVNLALFNDEATADMPGHCQYKMTIYPSQRFEDEYHTGTPETFLAVVALAFLGVIVVFFVYDLFVKRRNDKLISDAARSNELITSMFPGTIRDRLLDREGEQQTDSSANLTSYLINRSRHGELSKEDASKPMADLFLSTTVMFADISGFTPWSSTRDPSQVFALLETIFQSFDQLAKARSVMKVETVGDCYVAVSGLPKARKDHAVIMARFARDCLIKFQSLSREMEVTHGPDTGNLQLRIGINSGPVTGGVLRGERARFQLFGDTVNVASRMESTGVPGKIHVSKAVAEEIIKCGKGNWLTPRDNPITVKGKGVMETYFVNLSAKRDNSARDAESNDESTSNIEEFGGDDEGDEILVDGLSAKGTRLVDWNVSLFCDILKQIMARREDRELTQTNKFVLNPDGTPLEEVAEIISLPAYNASAALRQKNNKEIEIPEDVKKQLREYIHCIATMYKANSFHNFEHASHVVLSVDKLLGRIVAPSDLEDILRRRETEEGQCEMSATLHDHTYGITSDPLTQFALLLSALIHDVDHTGVPNTQLLIESRSLASVYNERSVAEQNSLDLSWDLFMDERYTELRTALFESPEDLKRFRKLVVNSVMATDIADKDLKNLRNARWDKAFKAPEEQAPQAQVPEEVVESVNRKATIVIEHVIQASDISHTMQHWHVYRKWNENLFVEMYQAFKAGRAATNPAEFWYKGEIGFFDFYIIPLAKKLKECGVFGVSSDEFLDYATKNRQEWIDKGESVVAELVEKHCTADN